MNGMLGRGLAVALLIGALTPTAVAAHAGHAGDHGFLYGALQPLLSLDHLLAAVVVAAVVAVMSAVAGRAFGIVRPTRRS